MLLISSRLIANCGGFSGEITASIAPVIAGCNPDWEGDGECDVPLNCPAGTDLDDCHLSPSYDTQQRQLARTVRFPNRATLDAGHPRTIEAVQLVPTHLHANADNIVMIGYPTGLPRKYTGGARIDSVSVPDSNTAPGQQCVAGASMPTTCIYENDNDCDPPNGYCPAGTDLADCSGVPGYNADSAALQAARTPPPTPADYCNWCADSLPFHLPSSPRVATFSCIASERSKHCRPPCARSMFCPSTAGREELRALSRA